VQQKAGENAYEYSKTLIAEARQTKPDVLEDARNYLRQVGQMGEAKEWKYRLSQGCVCSVMLKFRVYALDQSWATSADTDAVVD